jgi:hypothetical protein
METECKSSASVKSNKPWKRLSTELARSAAQAHTGRPCPKLRRPEVLKLQEVIEKPRRAFSDDHHFRLGHSLQPRREVWPRRSAALRRAP